jgi:hypothetical protein
VNNMLYKDNPFKILGVSPADGRRAIVSQAEEKALLLDSQKCADARTTLTNPQRRIAAEVHWFLDCTDEEIKEIDAAISDPSEDSDDLSWDRYSPLTQLNIQLALLDSRDFRNASSAKFYILGISRLYEAVDADSVIRLINEKRKEAGFPEVINRQDVETALSEMRSEIRQALSQRLQSLPQSQYTQIITLLSESYSGNQRYKGHAALEDTISEYQLFINDTLNQQGQAIIKTAKFITQGADRINVSQAVADLIADLYSWDKLAQPLQLGALTKGSSHGESKDMLQALRNLALKLHNDYGYSSESLAITRATQEVFKELPEYTDLLSDDSKTLTRIIAEKEAEDNLSPILEAVNAAYEGFKSCPDTQRNTKLNELIGIVKNANFHIKREYPDKTTSDSLRNSLGLLVRSFAIELHNELNRTEEALQLSIAIGPLFADLPEIAAKIKEDQTALANLKREQDNADRIAKGLKEIENLIQGVKISVSGDRDGKITALLSKMNEVDKLIKTAISDSETRIQIRERLAYMVRSIGIDLHNKYTDSQSSLRVITAVKNEFSDIPKLANTLNNDVATFNTQIGYQKVAAERKRQQEESQKTKRIIGGLIAAVVLLFICVDSCGSGTSSTSSKSTSYSSSSSTSTATAKPTATLVPQTMPASGKVFYCSTSNRPSSFKVTNNGSSNYYMKFVKAGTNIQVITFFVRANSTVEIDMPAGNLELKYAYGSTWYGESKLFGADTRYAKDEEYYDFTSYTWSITFNTTVNAGETMDVEPINADEF